MCRGQSDLRESVEELQWHNAPQIDKHTNSSNHNQLTLSASSWGDDEAASESTRIYSRIETLSVTVKVYFGWEDDYRLHQP